MSESQYIPNKVLRRGWTTGACAAAGASMALATILSDNIHDSIKISLPNNNFASMRAEFVKKTPDGVIVGVKKDAGDDPDVTHGAIIIVEIRKLPKGSGIKFQAGEGVGIVTQAGLPIAIGEPAISPKPRIYIAQNLMQIADEYQAPNDWLVIISVENGVEIAKKTWNSRLGIIGGLSILGTTGVVIPYSCSAWIHSIHRGIDIARANNFTIIGAATGKTSDKFLQDHYKLPESAILDMGDFAGGMLKYIAKHPIPKLVIAGGYGKITKLAQGNGDLHSARSQVDFQLLASWLGEPEIANYNMVGALLDKPYAEKLAEIIKKKARNTALELCNNQCDITIELVARG